MYDIPAERPHPSLTTCRAHTAEFPSTRSTRSVVVRTATIAIECASRASVLRLWPGEQAEPRSPETDP